MDRQASHIFGIGLVFSIIVLLFGAFIFVLVTAHNNATPAMLQPTSPGPAPASIAPVQLAPAAIKTKVEAPAPPALPAPRFPIGYNFALAQHGGKVTGGARPELLIDGNSTDYDGGNGYGHTQWNKKPADTFLIELKEAFEIDCVRFLLWDMEENRFYRYKLESAVNATGPWSVITDKTDPKEECRSWQVLRFDKKPVKFLRLTGTFNSANSGFHVVEFQACMAPPNGFPRDTHPPPPSNPDVQKVDLEF